MADRLVNIGETIVYGVAFDPKNSPKVLGMDLNELFASVGRLFDLLEEREIDYVLVGGIAMLAYVDGRNTQDIDLILSREDLKRMPELIVDDNNADFARAMFGDLRVDILFAENKLFEKVVQDYTVDKEFVGRHVPCATEEGLVVLKLFALPSLYRQFHFDKARLYEQDVAGLITRAHISGVERLIDQLRPMLLDSDVKEIEKIVADIQQRIANSRERFRGDG